MPNDIVVPDIPSVFAMSSEERQLLRNYRASSKRSRSCIRIVAQYGADEVTDAQVSEPVIEIAPSSNVLPFRLDRTGLPELRHE